MTSFFQFGVTTAKGVIKPGEFPPEFLFRQPVITGVKAAIAQAAHEAGFDCSDPDKLYRLIDAVLQAKNKHGYPDHWDGPAAFQSSIYPSTWTAAHAERQRKKGVLQAYREAEVANAAVPAFSLSANELIRKIHHITRGTGANCIPLATTRMTNKRGCPTVETENLTNKRAKTTHPNCQAPSFLSNKRPDYFDDDIQPLPNFPVLVPNATGKRRNKKKKQKKNVLGLNSNHEQVITAGTTKLFNSFVADLKDSTLKLSGNREALRVRWEMDRRLRLQEVTDDLIILNERCEDLDNALRRCVDVVEQRVMHAYGNAG